MPYVKPSVRARALNNPTTSGELNYCITQKAMRHIDGEINASQFSVEVMQAIENFLEIWPRNYESFNAVMGVLDCVPRELRRRLIDRYQIDVHLIEKELKAQSFLFYALTVAVYEDGKIEANGDVFTDYMVTEKII